MSQAPVANLVSRPELAAIFFRAVSDGLLVIVRVGDGDDRRYFTYTTDEGEAHGEGQLIALKDLARDGGGA